MGGFVSSVLGIKKEKPRPVVLPASTLSPGEEMKKSKKKLRAASAKRNILTSPLGLGGLEDTLA